MTSSATPTEGLSPAWRRRAILAGAVVVGWGFIAWAHNFHVTAAVVFLCLGWLAVVAGVHNLWRTGNVQIDEEDRDDSWWRPVGAREELEREKRALLKAIKEIDFDRQTGKMSDADAQVMTQLYRARAIEVIKAIDEIEAGAGSARDQIQRELRARLAIDGHTARKKAPAKATKPARSSKAKKQDKAKPATAKEEAPADLKVDGEVDTDKPAEAT